MTNPEAGQLDEGSDRPTEMSVERVEKTDGRYLIYYEWRTPEMPNWGRSALERTRETPDV